MEQRSCRRLGLASLVVACGFALGSPAQAAPLFSNGPVVDAAGLSILTLGVHASFGAGANPAVTVSDDFSIVGAPWTVESLNFFAYQTGASSFTFTGVTWSIRTGTDVNSAANVASGTSAVTNGGQIGYRVTSASLSNTQRPIFRIGADIPDLVLPAGTYFLTWALTGTLASGPFVPPVLGSYGTGNATQSIGGGAFDPVLDLTSPFGVPFEVLGTAAVPEPGVLAMWAGGLAAARLARRRRVR